MLADKVICRCSFNLHTTYVRMACEILNEPRRFGTVEWSESQSAALRRTDTRWTCLRTCLTSSLGGTKISCVTGLGWNRVGVDKRLAVRTGKLRQSPALHARPIDLVVFQEPSSFERKPRLRVDFTLRCFQRLFFPDLATQRCP